MNRRFSAALLTGALLAGLTLPAGALSVEDARSLLEARYVDSLPAPVYEAQSLEALLEALGDPYTVYYTPEVYEEFLSSVNGDELVGIGISLLGSGYVKAEHKTVLHALPVFCAAVAVAMGLNEWAYRTGMLEDHYFNVFYFSPHADPHLPLYSNVQNALGVDNPLSFVIYVVGFTLAASVMLLLARGILALTRGKKK